jgi:predicted site-specific integrase-resolvase
MTVVWLNPDQVAERLGIHRRTAMALMMEMNPVAISGNVRKRYRVSEESLNQWMLKHSNGRAIVSTGSQGSKKKLQRRG